MLLKYKADPADGPSGRPSLLMRYYPVLVSSRERELPRATYLRFCPHFKWSWEVLERVTQWASMSYREAIIRAGRTL